MNVADVRGRARQRGALRRDVLDQVEVQAGQVEPGDPEACTRYAHQAGHVLGGHFAALIRDVEAKEVAVERDRAAKVAHRDSDMVGRQREGRPGGLSHRRMVSDSRTAAAIRAWSGRTKSSSGGLNGTGTAGMHTRRTGARSVRQVSQSSAMVAAISAAIEHVGADSSTTISRPVLRTDWRIWSTSSGTSVRGSMTSTDTPSAANSSAAASARWTM